MIHIKDNVYIQADNNCYSLIEKRITTSDAKEPNKEYVYPLNSHHTTLSSALSAWVRMAQRKCVQERDMEIADAIESFQEIEQHARRLLDGIVREDALCTPTTID